LIVELFTVLVDISVHVRLCRALIILLLLLLFVTPSSTSILLFCLELLAQLLLELERRIDFGLGESTLDAFALAPLPTQLIDRSACDEYAVRSFELASHPLQSLPIDTSAQVVLNVERILEAKVAALALWCGQFHNSDSE